MAERLKQFDFTVQSAITSAESKGKNKYPWVDWFDGDIWKITQGEDFDTSPLMMERIIRTRASNKSHRAKVTLRHVPALNGDQPSIVMQRTDIEGPTQRKKAEAADKRAAKKVEAAKDAEETLRRAGITPTKDALQIANGAKKATAKVNGVAKKPAKKPSKRPSVVKV